MIPAFARVALRARSNSAPLIRLTLSQSRTYAAPTVARRANFVQELYLKELKAYKAAPVSASDAAGQVLEFREPSAPVSPEEADLISSLKDYESMAVEVETAAAEDGASPEAESWFIEEEDEGESHH